MERPVADVLPEKVERELDLIGIRPIHVNSAGYGVEIQLTHDGALDLLKLLQAEWDRRHAREIHEAHS